MSNRYLIGGMLALVSGFATGDEGTLADALYFGCSDRAMQGIETVVDCRETYPVIWLDGDTVVQGLNYSAIGWDLEPAGDSSRTVAITARSGTLANGVFTPDGSAEFEVMPAKEGRGLFDWQLGEIGKRVYRLEHKVTKGGSDVQEETLYGYFDIHGRATQAEVEAAVMDEIPHAAVVRQDEAWPWQPIDFAMAGAGIATGSDIPQGVAATTAFTVHGCGDFRYKYMMTGGELKVIADGETVAIFAEPAMLTALQISFADDREHEVSFVYTSAGDGTTAVLRNVRWDLPDENLRASGGYDAVRVDLRDALVRSPERLSDVLPFAYSSTNWIGDVEGVSAASVARVTIVRLKETEGVDMKDWDEVPGTLRELKREVGEGEVKWNARKGVWRATFDILEGNVSIHPESVIFDLRKSRSPGMALFLK